MRLSDHDASFLYNETASGPMHGASIAIIEGELDFETVLEHFQTRLYLVPRYRQRLVYVPMNLAHPKWVDDPDFDPKNHIKLHQLPPGSTLDVAQEVCIKLAEPMLPRDRPLWLTYLLTGVPGYTVMLMMGHHAMVDGASGVDISLVLFDIQANAKPPLPEDPPWKPKRLPTGGELTVEAMQEATQNLLQLNPFDSDTFSSTRMELLRRAGESITRFVTEPVLTAPWNAATVGPKRNFVWRKFSFTDFRSIRKVFGGTINDVVLTVVVEAASRYLRYHSEDVHGKHLRLMCPVSVRREDEKGTLGNRVSGIFPVFDAEPSEVTDRLRRVRGEMEQIKQNREAQALELMNESIPSIPPVTMAPTLLIGSNMDPSAMLARFPPPVPPKFGERPPLIGFNFTCTNVPGVQTPLYLAGHRVLDSMGLLMLSGTLGYGVAVASYDKQLYFNFVCDPRLMPDLEVMADGVEAAFSELLQAAEQSATEQPAA